MFNNRFKETEQGRLNFIKKVSKMALSKWEKEQAIKERAEDLKRWKQKIKIK